MSCSVLSASRTDDCIKGEKTSQHSPPFVLAMLRAKPASRKRSSPQVCSSPPATTPMAVAMARLV